MSKEDQIKTLERRLSQSVTDCSAYTKRVEIEQKKIESLKKQIKELSEDVYSS